MINYIINILFKFFIYIIYSYANDRDILAINGKFEENDGWTYIVSTSIKDDALKPEV